MPLNRWEARGIFVVALCAAVMCMLATAPRSHAAPGEDATVVAAPPFVLGEDETQGAIASCPAGRVALGGGVGSTTSTEGSRVMVSHPLDAGLTTSGTVSGDVPTSWYTAVQHRDDSTGTYTVFAICSATADAFVSATSATSVGTGGRMQTVPPCPAGSRATSGGMGTTADPDSWLEVSSPLDSTGTIAGTTTGDVAASWYSSVTNYGSSKLYKGFAVCSATSNATIVATPPFTLTGAGLGPASFADEAVSCLGGRAIGGGVGTTADPPHSFIVQSGPLDSTGTTAGTTTGDIAASWYTHVGNVFTDATYKLFAVCTPPPPSVAPRRCKKGFKLKKVKGKRKCVKKKKKKKKK